MESSFEKIYPASLQFLEPLSIQNLYHEIVDQSCNLVNAKYGSLVLKTDNGFERVYTTLPNSTEIGIRKDGYTVEVFKTQKAFVINDKPPRIINNKILDLGIKSSIFVPLCYKKQSIGVLTMHSDQNQNFDNSDLQTLELFGAMITLAIRNCHLHDEMQAAIISRDTFLSMATHELRTPLTTISGFLQLLRSKFPKNDSSESSWIDQVLYETDRLADLINTLLEISRIKTGRTNYMFTECHLKEIIQSVLKKYDNRPSDHKIRFIDNLGRYSDKIIADPSKLTQLLSNLLSNACRFSSSDDEVVINLAYKQPFFVLEIVDHGKGIEKNELAQIFNENYQGMADRNQGMGLGLFLAKHIVETHHGDIHIKSKIGRGTTVQVKLPEFNSEE
jgi:signal transduction histidine kinase